MTTETITTAEIVPSTSKVYKLGGRWYWVTSEHEVLKSGSKFFYVVPQNKDPRYAQIGQAKLKYVHYLDPVLVREATAPVWEWVTKQIERHADAPHCAHHIEFRSECYSCRVEREYA